MEFANNRELSGEEFEQIKGWLGTTLSKVMGESDDVFIEYVMVMIVNGKTMQEISADLEAFVGEPACSDFALSLGEYLRTLLPSEEEEVGENSNNGDDDEEAGKQKETESKIITLSSSKKVLQPLKSSRSSASAADKADKNKMNGALKTTRPGDKKAESNSGGLKSGRKQVKQSKIVQEALKNMKQKDEEKNKKRPKGNQVNNSEDSNSNKRQRNVVVSNQQMQQQQQQQQQFPFNNGVGGANMDGMLAAYQQNMMQMMMQMMGQQGGGDGNMPHAFPMQAPFPPNQFNQFNQPHYGGGYKGAGGRGGGKGGKGGGRGGGYVGSAPPPPAPPGPLPIAPALSTEGGDSIQDQDTGAVKTYSGSGTSAEAWSYGHGKGMYQGRGGKGGKGGRGGRGWGYKGAGRGSFEHKTWVRPPDNDSELVSKRVE